MDVVRSVLVTFAMALVSVLMGCSQETQHVETSDISTEPTVAADSVGGEAEEVVLASATMDRAESAHDATERIRDEITPWDAAEPHRFSTAANDYALTRSFRRFICRPLQEMIDELELIGPCFSPGVVWGSAHGGNSFWVSEKDPDHYIEVIFKRDIEGKTVLRIRLHDRERRE
jgi:hypothetical protein